MKTRRSEQKLGINSLILVSIDSIQNQGEKATFEKLLKQCFFQFPDIFSFAKLKQWPDARKLDRPLRALRDKKLIKGDPQTCFVLTKAGKKSAQETSQLFRQKKLNLK